MVAVTERERPSPCLFEDSDGSVAPFFLGSGYAGVGKAAHVTLLGITQCCPIAPECHVEHRRVCAIIGNVEIEGFA